MGIVDLQIDNRFRVVDSTDMGRTKQYCLSLSVSNLCLFKRGKNLTLKTCAPDFSACSITKLYAKIKGVCAVSLFDILKTWQVCGSVAIYLDTFKQCAGVVVCCVCVCVGGGGGGG